MFELRKEFYATDEAGRELTIDINDELDKLVIKLDDEILKEWELDAPMDPDYVNANMSVAFDKALELANESYARVYK